MATTDIFTPGGRGKGGGVGRDRVGGAEEEADGGIKWEGR